MKKILNKLNGLHYRQEYLCFAKGSFQHPLHIYLLADGKIAKDITYSHLFVGYCPLIFALHSSSSNDPLMDSEIEIILSQKIIDINEYPEKKDAIARLSLKLIRKQPAGNLKVYYYEGMIGTHHFLSAFHQNIISMYNRRYNKNPGNVFLHDNLYKQVQIAYAVPRIISLVTVGDGESFNLFPTDLHGPVAKHFYIDSLRHGGKACQQVEKFGKMVISEVNAGAYKTVYALGKNHMQELKDKSHFPFGNTTSSIFQLPLPEGVIGYRELELMESFEHGIHKLLFFKVVSNHAGEESATLAHIHATYATWRHNKGLAGNYLLR